MTNYAYPPYFGPPDVFPLRYPFQPIKKKPTTEKEGEIKPYTPEWWRKAIITATQFKRQHPHAEIVAIKPDFTIVYKLKPPPKPLNIPFGVYWRKEEFEKVYGVKFEGVPEEAWIRGVKTTPEGYIVTYELPEKQKPETKKTSYQKWLEWLKQKPERYIATFPEKFGIPTEAKIKEITKTEEGKYLVKYELPSSAPLPKQEEPWRPKVTIQMWHYGMPEPIVKEIPPEVLIQSGLIAGTIFTGVTAPGAAVVGTGIGIVGRQIEKILLEEPQPLTLQEIASAGVSGAVAGGVTKAAAPILAKVPFLFSPSLKATTARITMATAAGSAIAIASGESALKGAARGAIYSATAELMLRGMVRFKPSLVMHKAIEKEEFKSPTKEKDWFLAVKKPKGFKSPTPLNETFRKFRKDAPKWMLFEEPQQQLLLLERPTIQKTLIIEPLFAEPTIIPITQQIIEIPTKIKVKTPQDILLPSKPERLTKETAAPTPLVRSFSREELFTHSSTPPIYGESVDLGVEQATAQKQSIKQLQKQVALTQLQLKSRSHESEVKKARRKKQKKKRLIKWRVKIHPIREPSELFQQLKGGRIKI